MIEKPMDHSRISPELAKAETRKEVLGLALGAASTCWENPEGAGTFDSSQARLILEDTFDRLHELDTSGDRPLAGVPTDMLFTELGKRMAS